MSISKRIADNNIIDLNALVVSLWGIGEQLRYGRQPESKRAIQKLEVIKNEIKRFEEDEGSLIIGLKTYYHFNDSELQEIEMSRFNQYAKELEKGNVEETIIHLKALNNKLKNKISDDFSIKKPYAL